ncbi:MAG: S-layer homology domain-containing protein [Bryobacterales bacterium]|nr:S-layer homology domain-containing protein [Bryobacterales bacterium]
MWFVSGFLASVLWLVPVARAQQQVGETRRLADDAVVGVWDGDQWKLRISSPGAAAMLLHVEEFDALRGRLEIGGRVYGEASFWSLPRTGDQLTVTYQPNDPADRTLPFRLTEYAHFYARPQGKTTVREIASCHVDTGQTDLIPVSSATVLVLYPDTVLGQPVWLACTGTYVADRLNTNRRYVITANHCVRRPEQVQSAQFYWSRFGERTEVSNWPVSQITTGAVLRKTVSEAEGDATLIELTHTPPAFATRLTVSADELVAGSATYTFHHPDSSWMRFTSGAREAPVSGMDTGILAEGSFRPSDYYYKITEPIGLTDYGSSGAGLRTSATMFGVLSYGPAVTCNPQGRHGIYGRISTFLPRVQEYLWNNPAGSCSAETSAANLTVNASGTSGTFTVTAPGACRWAVAADSEYIVVSPKSGSGAATISYQILGNTGAGERLGTVSVLSEQRRVVHYAQRGIDSTALLSDVPSTHLFAPHIQYMLRQGVTAYGCAQANGYCPDAVMTRGQMAEFIIKSLFGANVVVDLTPAFTDVPFSHPAFVYVQKMKELRITDGCTTTTYCPDDPVTRGQMAAFIVRAWNVKNGRDSRASFDFLATPYFSDTPASNIFFGPIQKMKELGITSGCTAANYCPNNPNTRGEIAVFLGRGVFALWEGRPN